MQKHDQRLDSWKEIADYLGREVRTAIRWEHEKGLPIRRVPGGVRHSVFAFTAELDAWLVVQQGGNGIGTNPPAESNGHSGLHSQNISIPVTTDAEIDFPFVPKGLAPKRLFATWQIFAIAVAVIASTGAYLGFRSARIRAAALEPEMTFTRTDYAASGPSQIFAADFNADGKIDLLFNNRDSNALTVLPGNGDGTFGPRIDSPAVGSPELVAIGDFNQDGILDAAVASQLTAGVLIELGNGDGTFRKFTTLKTPGQGRSVIVGDFNRDGHLDMATASASPDSVTIFLGQGDGTFLLKTTKSTSVNYLGLFAADMNRDGILDIVCMNSIYRASDRLTILIGSGDGNFQAQALGENTRDVLRVAVSDVNGDGFNDLITTNLNDQISILLGSSNLLFTHLSDLNSERGFALISPRDFDGDGTLDLLVLTAFADKISIFLGNGDGTFKPKVDFAVGGYPYAVAVADFNGDGKLDLAVGNHGGNSVSVLLNTSKPRKQMAAGQR